MRYAAVFLGLIAVLAFVGCGDDDPVSSMSEEGINAPAGKLVMSATKAGGYPGRHVLQSLFQAQNRAFDAHDVDTWVSYLTDDAIHDYVPAPTPVTGKEEQRAFMTDVFQAFPDGQSTNQRLLISGNIMVLEWIFTGTLEGVWMGLGPTGMGGPTPHLTIFEFEGEKEKHLTTYFDMITFMTNSGLMEPSELPPLEPSIELPDPEPTGLSPIQGAREIVRRWNTHDISLYAQMIRPDATLTQLGMPMDRDTYVAAMEAIYYSAFPDGKLAITRVVDMGDGWVIFEATFNGTHQGDYLGVPPTELPIVNRLVSLNRFDEEGVATDIANYFDNLGVLVQMGAIPAP